MSLSKKSGYTLPDNRTGIFSSDKLKKAVTNWRYRFWIGDAKISQNRIYEEIADGISSTADTVKHWFVGRHAPSDFEKVESLAKFLGVAVEELLIFEDEEKEEMNVNTNENIQVETIEDIKEASNIGMDCSFYYLMSMFIEKFRKISNDEPDHKKIEELRNNYRGIYKLLMLARFNMAKKQFDELCSFADNYLQQMIVYEEFLDSEFLEECAPEDIISEYEFKVAPWWGNLYSSINEASDEYVYFMDTLAQQIEEEKYKVDTLSFELCNSRIIIDNAYARLEEIFKDYRTE